MREGKASRYTATERTRLRRTRTSGLWVLAYKVPGVGPETVLYVEIQAGRFQGPEPPRTVLKNLSGGLWQITGVPKNRKFGPHSVASPEVWGPCWRTPETWDCWDAISVPLLSNLQMPSRPKLARIDLNFRATCTGCETHNPMPIHQLWFHIRVKGSREQESPP